MARLANNITKLDITIVLFAVIASILAIVFINILVYNGGAEGVIIELNGEIYAKYNFNSIQNCKIVEIKSEYGYNIIEINNKKVRVIDASCDDKLDVHTGWIDKPNQILVCLPNKLLIKLVGNSNIDAVAY